MRRRGMAPGTWRALPKVERVEMLAADMLRDEQLGRLLEQLNTMAEDLGPESIIAQTLILLAE